MRICLVSFSPCRQVVVVVTHDQFVTGVTNLLCCHATTYAGALERYDAAEHHRPATNTGTACSAVPKPGALYNCGSRVLPRPPPRLPCTW